MNLSKYINVKRIEFVLTYNCSGKCKHCSVADQLNSDTTNHHVRIKEATETIQWLAKHYEVSSVMTFGGEPLLYPEVTCAIHSTARDCGIEARQIITNGYFSKDISRIQEVANLISHSGVNNLILSVDAFHQETIPAEYVYAFAKALKQTQLTNFRLQPAWVVCKDHENTYNTQTQHILSSFADLDISISKGNNITLSGNAAKYLTEYYESPKLDLSKACGTAPYTQPLTDITCLSIVPNGDVMVCSFVIGNIYEESIETIVSRYNPYDNIYTKALITGGGSALVELASANGINVDSSKCYSLCDLCRKIVKSTN